MLLAAYTVVHDCDKILYPWRESVRSSLALADEVIVCDAESTDGTYEALLAMAEREPRLKVCRHRWGDDYRILPTICNGLLESPTCRVARFSIQVQADEVVCEWTIGATRSFLGELDAKVGLGRPFYRHFCPDFRTTWPFLYDRKAVLDRTSARVRWAVARGGDACSLVGRPTADLPLEIHHVGKVQVGREAEALTKELSFMALYAKDYPEFPDPKVVAQKESGRLDYGRVFDPSLFTPYDGPQPIFLREWIERMEGR